MATAENSNLTIRMSEQLSSSVGSAEADRIMKESRMRDFDSMSPNLVAAMGDNPSLKALRAQLATLETQQAQLTAKYGPRHLKIINFQTQTTGSWVKQCLSQLVTRGFEFRLPIPRRSQDFRQVALGLPAE